LTKVDDSRTSTIYRMGNPESTEDPKKIPTSDAALHRIATGGIIFLVLAALAFCTAIAAILIRIFVESKYKQPETITLIEMANDYLPSVLAFLMGIVAAFIGYALLRVAGTATKEVIPKQDKDLLNKMLEEGNHDGINEYIKLGSLSGVIGSFTKLGITGLPLATIGLTTFFSVLGLTPSGSQGALFDLAKLTLGAFIGSYVQRQGSESIRPLSTHEASTAPTTKRSSERSSADSSSQKATLETR
jgi:hypothetical protein